MEKVGEELVWRLGDGRRYLSLGVRGTQRIANV